MTNLAQKCRKAANVNQERGGELEAYQSQECSS
jgi:hypothetical protein